MTALRFENQEKEYFQWLARNPNGYVLTTYKTFRARHIRLHAANCRLIRQYMRHMTEDAFTGQQFKKVCSVQIEDLQSWARDQGYPSLPRCKRCNPREL